MVSRPAFLLDRGIAGQVDAAVSLSFTYPNGRSENRNATAGSAQHMDAFTHLPESARKPFEAIQVEFRAGVLVTRIILLGRSRKRRILQQAKTVVETHASRLAVSR